MAKKTGDYEIPFDKNGNQLDYDGWGVHERVANHEFTDTLTFKSASRGRSAVGFEFARKDGRTVNVFLRDMEKWIHTLRDGVISGKFTFIKRGANYGCTLVEEA